MGLDRKVFLHDKEGVYSTNYNVPRHSSNKTEIISRSMVPVYKKLIEENPNWCIDKEISYIKVVSDENFAKIKEKQLERIPVVPIDQLIEEQSHAKKEEHALNTFRGVPAGYVEHNGILIPRSSLN